jgi:hypothetical protein
MQAFYRHLHKGERKDEALRHAKLDYLASVSEPELKSPYHWAGFVLMGDASPVYKAGNQIGIIGIGAGFLLLLAFLLWIRARRRLVRGS